MNKWDWVKNTNYRNISLKKEINEDIKVLAINGPHTLT